MQWVSVEITPDVLLVCLAVSRSTSLADAIRELFATPEDALPDDQREYREYVGARRKAAGASVP